MLPELAKNVLLSAAVYYLLVSGAKFMNIDSHKLIQNEGRFIEYSNPITIEAIQTYFGNYCSTFSVEEIALVEVRSADDPKPRILLGYVTSEPAYIENWLTNYDRIHASSSEESQIITIPIAVYTFENHYLFLKSEQLSKIALESINLLAQQVTHLFEHNHITHHYLGFQSALKLSELIQLYGHEQEGAIASLRLILDLARRTIVESGDQARMVSRLDTAFACLEQMRARLSVICNYGYVRYNSLTTSTAIDMLTGFAEYIIGGKDSRYFSVSASDEYNNLSVPGVVPIVLGSMIKNSIEAFRTMESSGELEIKMDIKCQSSEKQLQFILTDNGPGIPDEAKGKIFDPLYTTKSQGGGFGLYLSKRLVEDIGGRLSLESSEIGKGTVFTLITPFQLNNGD